MKLYMAYLAMGFSLALIVALALAGCTGGDPTGPTVDITGNSGPVTVNVPTNTSIVATAPCAVQNPNNTKSVKPSNGAPNCATDNSTHSSDESDEAGQ